MLFTFPSRYLFTIGQSVVLSLGEWSPLLQTGFLVSRPTLILSAFYSYGAITLYGPPSHAVLILFTEQLGWSDFARRYFRSLGWFPFLELLRCFSSLSSLYKPMYSVCNNHKWLGSPIRTSADQCLFTTPRSFSQCITSFFASDCQGIHQMPLPIAWFLQYKYFASAKYLYRSTKNLPVFLLEKLLKCIFLYFLPRFFLIIQYFYHTIQLLPYSRCSITSLLEFLVEVRRIELLTPCLQSRCSPSWAIPPYRSAAFFDSISQNISLCTKSYTASIFRGYNLKKSPNIASCNMLSLKLYQNFIIGDIAPWFSSAVYKLVHKRENHKQEPD